MTEIQTCICGRNQATQECKVCMIPLCVPCSVLHTQGMHFQDVKALGVLQTTPEKQMAVLTHLVEHVRQSIKDQRLIAGSAIIRRNGTIETVALPLVSEVAAKELVQEAQIGHVAIAVVNNPQLLSSDEYFVDIVSIMGTNVLRVSIPFHFDSTGARPGRPIGFLADPIPVAEEAIKLMSTGARVPVIERKDIASMSLEQLKAELERNRLQRQAAAKSGKVRAKSGKKKEASTKTTAKQYIRELEKLGQPVPDHIRELAR